MKLPNKFPLTGVAHALSAMLLTFINAQAGVAAPTGGQVVQGAATVQQSSPSRTDINQSSDKAIINWREFSIKKGEQVNFNQPSGSSVTLNRVTGASVSDIQGALTANGNVFLINPNGIIFGKGSIVDVAGLVASTADIDDTQFMAGQFEFSGSGSGTVVNEGQITVQQGGLVALVAPTVRNSGVIQATLGRVALVSGNTFTIDLYGDGLINLAVDGKVAQGFVSHSGTINADGGRVLISAEAAKSVVDNVINMDGVVQARSIAGNDGSIVLAGGNVAVAGTLDVSGAGQSGGDIDVLGQAITVTGRLDASGDTGGGEIHIGGDFQGNGNRQRASTTLIAQGADIQANAHNNGDGGTIIVWSDDQTNVDGQLSATGGQQAGDGGFVETSSAGTLDFTTSVDVKANNGAAGTWLIDPEDITIDRGYADLIEDSLNDGSSVIVQTADQGSGEGNLTVAASITKDSGGDAALSLRAHNNLNVNAPITSSSGALDVNLQAGNAVNVNSEISTNGGGVFVSKWDRGAVQPLTAEASAADQGAADQEVEDAVLAEDVAKEVVVDVATGVSTTLQPLPADSGVVASANGASAVTPTSNSLATRESAVAVTSSVLAAVPATDSTVSAVQEAVVSTRVITGSIDITIAESANVTTEGGDIVLLAGPEGDVQVASVLDTGVTGPTKNQGGDVEILGQNVRLQSTAFVDTSSEAATVSGIGGGNILIGVDATGVTTQVAETVVIEQGARINASAVLAGAAGNVFVESQNETRMAGNIRAQGIDASDGGFVSLSSEGRLDYTGSVNVRSNNIDEHNGGTVVFAAENITVQGERGSSAVLTQLGVDQLQQLGDVDLAIISEQDLTLEDIDASDTLVQGASGFGDERQARAVALVSNNGSVIADDAALAVDGGDLFVSANAGVNLGDVSNDGGSVSLLATTGDITTAEIDIEGGSLVVNADQGGFISQDITLSRVVIDASNFSNILLGAGEVDINTLGDIALQDVSVDNHFSAVSTNGAFSSNNISSQSRFGPILDLGGGIEIAANNRVTTDSLRGGLIEVTSTDDSFVSDGFIFGETLNIDAQSLNLNRASANNINITVNDGLASSATLTLNNVGSEDNTLTFNIVDDAQPSDVIFSSSVDEDTILAASNTSNAAFLITPVMPVSNFFSANNQLIDAGDLARVIDDIEVNVAPLLGIGNQGFGVTVISPLEPIQPTISGSIVAPATIDAPPVVEGVVIERPQVPDVSLVTPPPVSMPSNPGSDDPQTVVQPVASPVITEPVEIAQVVNNVEPMLAAADPANSVRQLNAIEEELQTERNGDDDVVAESSSTCADNHHLAWLQFGIRSVAETADMGRGDGTSADDVFQNCY